MYKETKVTASKAWDLEHAIGYDESDCALKCGKCGKPTSTEALLISKEKAKELGICVCRQPDYIFCEEL
jgi:hypothetical protein